MPSRGTIYLLFVAVGFVITTANLLIYTAMTKDSKTRHAVHPHHHHFTGGDSIEKPLEGHRAAVKDHVRPAHEGLGIGSSHPRVEKPPVTVHPSEIAQGDHNGRVHRAHHDRLEARGDNVATRDADKKRRPAKEQEEGAHQHGRSASSKPHHPHHHRDESSHSGESATTKAPPHHRKHGGGGGGGGNGKIKHRYVASESDRSFANMTYNEGLDRYHAFLLENTEEIEQSSNKFRDIEERSHAGIRLPTDEETLLAEYGLEGPGYSPTDAFCDPLNADFTPTLDAACLAYLSDIRNMLSLKPMSSILSSGRTIKFKVYYKHDNITAVLKVSQKKFALEPASEAIALQVDRWLGFQRVPPVAWAPIPQDFLRAASATMDAFYAKWFDKFVLHYDTTRHLTSTCFKHPPPNSDAHGEHRCLNVSLQLWMADVHNAEETVLRPSEAYRTYLELPTPDNADPIKLKDRLTPFLPSGGPNPRYIGLGELTDEFVFDLVIGNTDRWFGHNSFALGGCLPESRCGQNPTYASAPKSKSTMRLAFIDQGSSFYRKGAPEMNPFSTNYDKLCRFRRRTVDRVLEVVPEGTDIEGGGTVIFNAIRSRIPGGVFSVHNLGLFRAAGGRLATLAAHMRQCLQKHNESSVKFFE